MRKVDKVLQNAIGNMEETKVYENFVIGSSKEDLLRGHVPGEYLAYAKPFLNVTVL